jgi:hypothetical protein
MKNARMVKLIGVAVAILVVLQVAAATALPRWNTVTVVPTASGPWLCGPAIVIQNMGGPSWLVTPARTVPVVPTASPWYILRGSARPSPFDSPFVGRGSPVPPKPDELLCRPLSAPRSIWPGRPPGAYGSNLAR